MIRLSWKKCLLAGAFLIAACLPLLPHVLRMAGDFLVVSDTLEPAPVIVLLAGEPESRAPEAVRIYDQRLGKEIWVSGPAEYRRGRAIFAKSDVSPDSIRILPGNPMNTAEELCVIDQVLNASGYDRVMLVTSKYHTRRVSVLWHKLMGEDKKAIVRYTENDTFDSAHWWRKKADAFRVFHEWLGLFSAWSGIAKMQLAMKSSMPNATVHQARNGCRVGF